MSIKARDKLTDGKPCLHCDKPNVRGSRYCRVCRDRVRKGIPLDLNEWPTYREMKRIGGGGPRPPILYGRGRPK